MHVPPDEMHRLPARLREIPLGTVRRMQAYLRCARRYLWWASVYGDCRLPELEGPPDAFDGLMAVLASRLRGVGRGRAHFNCSLT